MSYSLSPRVLAFLSACIVTVLVTGCENLHFKPRLFEERMAAPATGLDGTEAVRKPFEAGTQTRNGVVGESASTPPLTGTSGTPGTDPATPYYAPGSGQFVRPPKRRTVSTPPTGDSAAAEFRYTFNETPLREVILALLGKDGLGVSYRVDPGVQGAVTLHTVRPIPRAAVLPMLEMVLRTNNAALVEQRGIYHVVTRQNALRGYTAPQLGDTRERLPSGFAVRIVPLKFIAAQEMHKILEPFASPENIVRVDTPRNILVLAGSKGELEQLLDTIDTFDVDWMGGMSVGMFRPDFVAADVLARELRQIVDDEGKGPLAGIVRIIELERLNALLVITPRRVYLDRIASWIERLDIDPGGVGQRLYVYHVQNGRAAELAAVLTQVFESDEASAIPPPELAPGSVPTEIGSSASQRTAPNPATGNVGNAVAGTTANQGSSAAGARNPRNTGQSAANTPRPVGTSRLNSPGAANAAGNGGLTLAEASSIRIIADEINNALLIKATAQEYKLVEAALRELDIVPLQVLVEATIAEVTLSDDLEFGLEWFFKNHHGNNKSGSATLDLGAGGLAAVTPGFSYALTDAAGVVRAVLNTLASESRVNILSSPSLMVLNNQTATINVGDEVPVTTQQQQSTAGTSTIVNNIEFRDTGVLLTVTPRVNAGGLVTMEVEQEVSNVAAGTGGSLTPTIQQRKITSTVAVRSGDTVVLGGLIRENTSLSRSGLPILHELPVIGPLFGATGQEQRRTELVVLITPRAVQSRVSAQEITEEFRRKMRSLRPIDTPPLVPPQ